MANIPRFHKGLKADLPSSGLTEGHYYQCTDTGELYLATSATDKVLVGKGKTAVATGVKGDTESSYRTGDVNITPTNIGLGDPEELVFTLADGTEKIISVATQVDRRFAVRVIGEGTQTICLNKQLTGEGEKVEYSFDGINWEDMPYAVSANDAARIESIARDKVAAMVANGTDDADGDLYNRVLDEEYANAELTESVPGAVSFTGKVYVRAKMPRWGTSTGEGNYRFVFGDANVKVKVSGDIGNLLDYANPSVDLPTGAFAYLFRNAAAIGDAGNLLLPATTSANCYAYMFANCTSLVNAPALPATKLVGACYLNMFYYCTSLVNAPALPATKLAGYCYRSMFNGCTKLNQVESHATDIAATDCTRNWLNNVSSTGIFRCPSSMVDVWPRGVSGIPEGWTIQAI